MRFLAYILFLLTTSSLFAQHGGIWFTQNKGQWNDNVLYKAKIPAGNLYLENHRLLYQFYNEEDMIRMDEIHHGTIPNATLSDSTIRLHTLSVEFVNANIAKTSHLFENHHSENYFLGNGKTGTNVHSYQEVGYTNLYHNIDAKFYTSANTLKYDFVVQPNGEPEQIQLKYTGADQLYLKDDHLHIKTSVNTMIEHKPYAYQVINGKEKEVKCKFVLNNNVLTFEFPNSYDKSKTLIIDPALIFASYSGSTIGNWGFTSTFDEAGHLYGGGVAFGTGYPITIGAYQTTFNGGVRDVSISKFSEDGSQLIYSTYLGGNNQDSPHSLVVNSKNQLVIFGTTSSPDYPVTLTTYDDSHNGGNDIFVSILNPTGDSLLASTFVGGSADDGRNLYAPLKYNYADDYRGEVIVDENDNVFVASTTISDDFPTTAGVIEPNFMLGGGNQNACVFKLNPALTSLEWSTYFGGNMNDAAYSMQFDELGNILFTGGTQSFDLPVSANALNQTIGGETDGYIVKMNANASSILACTYIGTDELDQTFFVQLDTANNVYVIGQTEGSYPITPSTVYHDTAAGQFLHKLTPDLSSTLFSTTFGSGDSLPDISLSAFLVNECNYILISGWGGTVNSQYSSAISSSTFDMPITPNALQPTTDGSDYYLMMLGEDADTLLYGTFFGGASSSEHVDGGTSRFDKKGIVYQAVCAGCFGNNDFPTTPGAYSNVNGTSLPGNSAQCNLGVFKLDLSKLTANAEVYTTPYYCIGEEVHFQNLSNGGIGYFWDFGDGHSSTDFEPTHTYDTAGTYSVRLVVLDSVSCVLSDTDYVDVFVNPPPTGIVDPISGVCLGDTAVLITSGGNSYEWLQNYHISNTLTSSPLVWPEYDFTYSVIVSDNCGSDTVEVYVPVFQPNISIDPDTNICRGDSLKIEAYNGKFYDWSPGSTLSATDIADPIAFPYNTTTYDVRITDLNNCVWDTFMTLTIDTVLAKAIVSRDTVICFGDSAQLSVTGGEFYQWQPAGSLSSATNQYPIAFPSTTTTYSVTSTNSCSTADNSVTVEVHSVYAETSPDTAVCIGHDATVWVDGEGSYWWEPNYLVPNPTSDSNTFTVQHSTYLSITVTDSLNCSVDLTVFVDTLPSPKLNLGDDLIVDWGSEIVLNGTSDATIYQWSPCLGLSCCDCPEPTVVHDESITYVLNVASVNNCTNSDTISIVYDGSLYVPKAFTPNGDGNNDIFYAYGKDIKIFNMKIFNRWGELLFESDDLHKGWDGFFKGVLSQTETYVWRIKYEDVRRQPKEMYGTVSLIR